MLEPTRTPHTESMELCVMVRAENMVEARKAVAPFLAEEESVNWRTVYPNFNPAKALQGARAKEGLTQRSLAALAGIPQRHISEMENGKRPIGKVMAKRFAKVLKVDYRVML